MLTVVLVGVVVLQGLPTPALATSTPAAAQVASDSLVRQAPGSMVIDYPGGFTSSLPSRLRRADIGIVIRYVGAAKWKSLTRKEADALRRAGLDIATVYETKANWMLGGRAAGVAAAKQARAAVVACGGPRKPFVYFACDVGTHRYATVDSCLRGAASVLGADHVGIYGSYSICDHALKSGYASKAWQTEAWSSGKWLPQAVLYQPAHPFNGGLGIDYDSDLLRADDIGQWGYVPLGGTTWTPASTTSTATLRGVTFRDASHGWAVGEAGTIIRTTDSGATWTAASAPSTATLNSVVFSAANTGWAVGEDGTVIRTTDGGATWTGASAPGTATLNSVAFAGADVGCAVGADGTIIRTADGGSTWATASAPGTATLRSVAFADASNGWAVGDSGTVIRTTDGGSTWTAASTTATATLNSLAFADASDGWAVGASGKVIRTADGGMTWTASSTPATATLNCVAFPSALVGWAVGDSGTVIHTTDGGASWTAASSLTTTTLTSVAFPDADSGWAVGESGALMRASKDSVDVFGHIAGVVVDAHTGARVAGASVRIGSRQAVPTASDGSFVVARVTPGAYALTVTSPRYITLTTAKATVVSAGATATVKLRPVPRAATGVTMPSVSPDATRGVSVSFSATLTPASASSATVCTMHLSHYEQKTVTRTVKGKRKRVKIWYWRQRPVLTMTADASGRLLANVVFVSGGGWRVYATCSGSGRYLPSASATRGFSVR